MYCIGLPQVRRPRGAVLCSGSYRVTIKELAARCPHLRLRVLFQAHSGWWMSSLCCRPEVPIFSFLLTVGEVLAKWPSQHDGLPEVSRRRLPSLLGQSLTSCDSLGSDTSSHSWVSFTSTKCMCHTGNTQQEQDSEPTQDPASHGTNKGKWLLEGIYNFKTWYFFFPSETLKIWSFIELRWVKTKFISNKKIT